MAENNHDYRQITFLLWGAVIALASFTIANYYGVSGRKLIFPPVVAVGLYSLLVNQRYGKINQRGQTKFFTGASTLNIPNFSSAKQDTPSRELLTADQKRQWLDGFLVRQQEK